VSPPVDALQTLDAKHDALARLLIEMGDVVVAYSGGVDSTFLMAAAHDALGPRALAVTAVSASIPARELRRARQLARERGWSHATVPTQEVAREEYARNDPDRCYWCKIELFDVLGPIAADHDAVVVVGTNVDDLEDYRPGLTAARKRRIRAPLAEVGLAKSEIRALSARLGLETADVPASPCLASRFAYGVRVTAEGLRRIDKAEEALRALGFDVLRVRDHGEIARIEVPLEEVPRAAELHAEITAAVVELGWRYVALDLAGFRSGSMNEVLEGPRFGPPGA
jgi:uncharacterized protein